MTKKTNVTPFHGERIFSKTRAARYLGISERTLRRMTDRGEIPSFVFHGRRVYHRDDLERFIQQLKPWERPWNNDPKVG